MKIPLFSLLEVVNIKKEAIAKALWGKGKHIYNARIEWSLNVYSWNVKKHFSHCHFYVFPQWKINERNLFSWMFTSLAEKEDEHNDDDDGA